jgi:hypothetical protein
MVAALFCKYADPTTARAISAGTDPAERVHPEAIEAMGGDCSPFCTHKSSALLERKMRLILEEIAVQ